MIWRIWNNFTTVINLEIYGTSTTLPDYLTISHVYVRLKYGTKDEVSSIVSYVPGDLSSSVM